MSGNFMDGRKSSGNPPEKLKFGQTCRLLSQYLKEKGSIRNLDFGMNAKLEASSSGRPETSAAATTALNLLTDTEKSGTKSDEFINCFSYSVPALTTVEDAINNNTTSEKSEMEANAAQMTIFYAGQVIVIDNFPAADAKEVMLLASKGPNSNLDKTVENCGNIPYASAPIQAEEENQSRKQPINSNSDLPIARRASLHRFLEKRKDRASARAPYQLNNLTGESSKGHFDLNF